MSTSLTNDVPADQQAILRWRVHLAREHAGKTAVVAGVLVIASAFAYALYGSVLPALVIAFVLVGSLSDFLFPVTYALTESGVRASTPLGLRVMPWNSVKRAYVDDEGIKLSPFDKPSRFEGQRGVYLRFGDRRDEVLDIVRRFTDTNV